MPEVGSEVSNCAAKSKKPVWRYVGCVYVREDEWCNGFHPPFCGVRDPARIGIFHVYALQSLPVGGLYA